MNVEGGMQLSTLIPFRDDRFPSNLGNFKLDEHNVDEWSDTKDPSLLRHRGRKEVGKWVDTERNADIQIHREEDARQFPKGHENQRTEVIQGTSPESAFQIVRTERSFNESGIGKDSSILSSTSASYQMSSSRGTRFTSKATSNKTSTKTITTNSGRSERSDDFENLKIGAYPLDTSTQRERINVSRSGTMGIRRPPTRKQRNSYQEMEDESMGPMNNLIHESTNVSTGLQEPHSISETGFKNISPKIRIGFPVEVQVELRTKLKTKDMETYDGMGGESQEEVHQRPDTSPTISHNPIRYKRNSDGGRESHWRTESGSNIGNRRRKSYGFEPFDLDPTESVNAFPKSSSSILPTSYSFRSQDIRSSKGVPVGSVPCRESLLTPSAPARSWDLVQKIEAVAETSKKPFFERNSDSKNLNLFPVGPKMESVSRSTGKQIQRESLNEERDSLDASDLFSLENQALNSIDESKPSVPSNDRGPPNTSPSSERSRKLLKLLENTEVEGNPNNLSKLSNWESEWEKTRNELDRLRHSAQTPDPDVTESNKKDEKTLQSRRPYPFTSRSYIDDESKRSYFNGMGIFSSGSPSMGRYTNFNNNHEPEMKPNQISQTWISASDLKKPSKSAKDNELSTSISATSDPLKKALKKVEFCKTEVHFTPEPGRFHIVESDENKPSTVHLFRRRKRKTSAEKGHSDDHFELNENREEGIGAEEGQNLAQVAMNLEQHSKLQNASANLVSNEGEKETDNYSSKEDPNLQFSRSDNGVLDPFIMPILLPKSSQKPIWTESTKNMMELPEKGLPQMEILSTGLSFDELKIQKYLKQLKTSSDSLLDSGDSSEINYAENQYILNQVRGDYDENDEELHFRYGSFVPLATRRSLIEMNNRNRIMKRMNYSTNSQISDNSSTNSNFSLPHSENSRENFDELLKLAQVDSDIVSSTGSRAQNTTLNPRHSSQDKLRDRLSAQTKSELHPYDLPNKLYQIPSPVFPQEISVRPSHRAERRSFSSSPTRESPAYRHPKPPSPILPLQFSVYEKTGAALRQRFLSKNSKCACNSVKDPLTGDSQSTPSQIPVKGSPSLALPSKTVVIIGREESDREDSPNEDKPSQENPKAPPILGSMTFPKSTRTEPEWVIKAKAKAKDRETHGTDWMRIGQRFTENPNREAPWISELKTRGRHSPSGNEPPPLSTSSLVYPWQRDGKTSGGLQREKKLESEVLPPTTLPSPFENDEVETSPYKSLSVISTSTTNNKSIVDLNRDYESITVNPNQIELDLDPEMIFSSGKSSRNSGEESKQYGRQSFRRSTSKRNTRVGKVSHSKSSETTLEKKSIKNEGGAVSTEITNRKPLQASTTVNQCPITKENIGKEDEIGRTKGLPKPPKPPERISSLVKSQTIPTFSGSLEKKKKGLPTSKKSLIEGNPVESKMEEVSSNPASSLIIHRHPTLKVSKLPTRMTSSPTNNPIKPSSSTTSSPDETKSTTKPKTKPQTCLVTETKKLYKGKSVPSSGETMSVRTPRNPRIPGTHRPTTASPHQRKR